MPIGITFADVSGPILGSGQFIAQDVASGYRGYDNFYAEGLVGTDISLSGAFDGNDVYTILTYHFAQEVWFTVQGSYAQDDLISLTLGVGGDGLPGTLGPYAGVDTFFFNQDPFYTEWRWNEPAIVVPTGGFQDGVTYTISWEIKG